ncbi:hypothetical protein Bca4012_013297 [Brassica carinata]|uniref:Uncharacterized protein n=1 Tax=Brassica carinata TaxID=52824 RepID=A0A8X7Q357_BRACI|nr:hypothetical protein Bca52824_069127 [Brassica carinata]
MNTKTMRLPPRRMLTSDKRILPSVVAEKPTTSTTTAAEQAGSNQLLAGYLAHEFLSKGTLFGEQWNLARSESIAEARKNKPCHDIEPSDDYKRRRYVEVADILRADGAFMPGIVNPSQLARSLKL